jgi:hypothetical protein
MFGIAIHGCHGMLIFGPLKAKLHRKNFLLGVYSHVHIQKFAGEGSFFCGPQSTFFLFDFENYVTKIIS